MFLVIRTCDLMQHYADERVTPFFFHVFFLIRDLHFVCFCQGGTMLGPPDTVVELGETEVSEEIFMDYLSSLGESTYRSEENISQRRLLIIPVHIPREALLFCLCLLRGDRYRLFEHNCNTFTNEVAQFLTGRSIPSYITDLPSEVLST